MEILSVLNLFAALFFHWVLNSAIVLLIGDILAPGKRTITAILRVMGLSGVAGFQSYHRVLNRAVWSSLAAIHILSDTTRFAGGLMSGAAPRAVVPFVNPDLSFI